MLSVGREIGIETKKLVCHQCAWEGHGSELSTGLIRISRSDIYLYAYRCPECGGFDMRAKGKLLVFRLPDASIAHKSVNLATADDAETQPAALEKSNRSWK